MSKTDPYAAPSRMYASKKEVPVAETAEETVEEVPTGTITEVKTWVGSDVERAESALEVERGSDHSRVTLIEYLEDMVTS